MICSASRSFTATIWKFLTQYPYEPVNNICVFWPISIAHFRDAMSNFPRFRTNPSYSMGRSVNISKVSSANGPKHTYIVDRFIGVLCKEFPDYSCETTTRRTKYTYDNLLQSFLKLCFCQTTHVCS